MNGAARRRGSAAVRGCLNAEGPTWAKLATPGGTMSFAIPQRSSRRNGLGNGNLTGAGEEDGDLRQIWGKLRFQQLLPTEPEMEWGLNSAEVRRR